MIYTAGCGTPGNIVPADEVVTEEQTDSVATESNQPSEEDIASQERREEMEEQYRRELRERYQGQANGVTTYYVSAQRLFYMGRYQSALYHINKAAEIKETADILALRGSIFLGLGDMDRFAEQWRMALEMDEEVPIPNVPYLISQLKAEGLISQNYNPKN